MRIGEFCKNCNLSVKTAKWLYRNVFNDTAINNGKHKHFTVENVQWVKERQKGFFDKNLNLKQLKESSEEHYICDNGKIYSYKRGFFEERKPYLNKNGYYYITVWQIDKHITYRLHKLVAKYFIPNPNNYDAVNHIDGNKQNNTVNNLEWTTVKDNTIHAYKNGLIKSCTGIAKPIRITDKNGNVTQYSSLTQAMKTTGINKSYLNWLAEQQIFSPKHQIKVDFI